MGKVKAPKAHKVKEGVKSKSQNSFNPNRDVSQVRLKGAPYARSKATIKRLQMYRTGKAKRDSTGRIVKPAIFQGWLPSGTQARIAPHRKWFENSKVTTQDSLQKFQEEMGKVMKDPYKVVMRQTNLPVTLLQEAAKYQRPHILDTQPFSSVFGKKATRKKPKLMHTTSEGIAKQAALDIAAYDETKDSNLVVEGDGSKKAGAQWFTRVGTSRRIWSELYKVVDSSDVVLMVLDARDPEGTRPHVVERYVKDNAPHKHIVFILNKVDLVPVWVTMKWKAILSRERPTMAFHSSVTNSFGKGDLISLLRQFSVLHKDKRNISVGLVGYPNVGKSSIINTLRAKKVCKVAPIAGETKVWQYVTLMNRIFLIDCPGIVQEDKETEENVVLKGLVRVEYLTNPVDYIEEVLRKCRSSYLSVTYKVAAWETATDFLKAIGRRMGRLARGGEPDLNAVAKQVLTDFQRGKIPYFTPPPGHDSSKFEADKKAENERLERITRERREEEDRRELLAAGALAERSALTFREQTEEGETQPEAQTDGGESNKESASKKEEELMKRVEELKKAEKEKAEEEKAKNFPVQGVKQKFKGLKTALTFSENDRGVGADESDVEGEEAYDSGEDASDLGEDQLEEGDLKDTAAEEMQRSIEQFLADAKKASLLERPEELVEGNEEAVGECEEAEAMAEDQMDAEPTEAESEDSVNVPSTVKPKPKKSKKQVQLERSEPENEIASKKKTAKIFKDKSKAVEDVGAKVKTVSSVKDKEMSESKAKKTKLVASDSSKSINSKPKIKKTEEGKLETVDSGEPKRKMSKAERRRLKNGGNVAIELPAETGDKKSKKRKSGDIESNAEPAKKKIKTQPEKKLRSILKKKVVSSVETIATSASIDQSSVSSKSAASTSKSEKSIRERIEECSSEEEQSSSSEEEQEEEEAPKQQKQVRYVSAAPRYKKVIKAAKKQGDDVVAISSKAKRKADRDERKAMNPKRYYDFANVKNKNRSSKKAMDELMGARGHMKKKPNVAKPAGK